VQNFALFVLPDFKDDGIQPPTYPTDGHILFRNVASLVQPIGLGKQLSHFLEPNAPLRIGSEALTLSRIEAKAHLI